MVLSRIWSAFIIIAFMVAGFKMLQGDEQIFTRMVTGKSSDKYDSVFYYGTGNPTTMALSDTYEGNPCFNRCCNCRLCFNFKKQQPAFEN
jgi:hypothetical protein